MAEKNKGGRPTIYSQELADTICSKIADGKSMRTIARELNFALANFFVWMRTYPEFMAQYETAKKEQAEAMIEDIHEISDTEPNKVQTRYGESYDPAHVAWHKLRVDSRKWIASKLKPKKYGDSIIHQGDSTAPIQITSNVPMSFKKDGE